MNIKKILASAFMSVFTFALVANVAFAVGPADVTTDVNTCSPTIISATADGSSVANQYLVVDTDNEAVQYANIPTDSSTADISVGPFSENTTIYWHVFGGAERDYDMPLWNGYGEPTFGADIAAYAALEGGYGWVISDTDDPNPFVTWNEIEIAGCDPQKSTGGIKAKAGGANLQLNFNAHSDIDGVKGNVKYSNSAGGNFTGDVNVCYNQDGNEAAFVGEVTKGTYNDAYFKIEVQDNGNGKSGNPDRVRVRLSDSEFDCSISGSFPGVRTQGNLTVH